MSPVLAIVLLGTLFMVIVAALAWQGLSGGAGGDSAVYFLEDAAHFVHGALSEDAARRLDRDLVKRLLEWQIEYQQVEAPRTHGHTAVVGSGEALEYVLEKAAAAGYSVEPLAVAEVMAAEIDYLLAIGAVGRPVEEDRS